MAVMGEKGKIRKTYGITKGREGHWWETKEKYEKAYGKTKTKRKEMHWFVEKEKY